MKKVRIEKLPGIKEKEGIKRWDEERGEFAQISYKEEIRHIAFFEIKKGFSRGNHYHRNKEEIFYVVKGRIKAMFHDMDTGEQDERFLETGDLIRVQAYCGHIFTGVEDSYVIEFSPQIYDKEDTYGVNFGV